MNLLKKPLSKRIASRTEFDFGTLFLRARWQYQKNLLGNAGLQRSKNGENRLNH